ncbi:MAG: DUF1273 family protein [Oscillospiraceae bacterium]|nr:DUF1273 family protein [Oscillospiraceae bacterium]
MTCAIVSTGEEKNFSKEELEKVQHTLATLIFKLRDEGFTDFYVNCERYIPMWAGAVAAVIGERAHLIIPYEEQCADWSEEDRNYYYLVHQRPEATVTFVSKHYYKGCYAAADKIMAENSDKVFVFGDSHFISGIAKEKTEFVPFF